MYNSGSAVSTGFQKPVYRLGAQNKGEMMQKKSAI